MATEQVSELNDVLTVARHRVNGRDEVPQHGAAVLDVAEGAQAANGGEDVEHLIGHGVPPVIGGL